MANPLGVAQSAAQSDRWAVRPAPPQPRGPDDQYHQAAKRGRWNLGGSCYVFDCAEGTEVG